MIRIQSPNKILLAKKKKKIKIFLDMDGCISNWLKSACKVCDIDLNDKGIRDTLKNGSMDDIIDEKVLWDKIEKAGVEWWENLELFPWSKKLYKAVEDLAGEFAILSSPGKYTKIASLACNGKVLWLDKHFKNKESYLFTYKKFLCSGPNTILIDDSQKKIDPFVDAGGHGFLWPHDLALLDGDVDADKTIEELVQYIKEL